MSAIQLPVVLTIGFTGHRSLSDESKSRDRIRSFLSQHKANAVGTVCGISSVAAGSDLLFAESCIALNIPLRVLLPLPREEFRKDFDPTSWSRAEVVMRDALSVEEVGMGDLRKERYYECGLSTVQQSQTLLALWNGLPAKGLGGTEEIVGYARQIGKPVVWIHSENGAVEELGDRRLREIHVDAELKFLNDLPAQGLAVVDDSAAALAKGWLAKLDANATLAAPKVRRMAALPILLTAVAAVASGAASHMHPEKAWLVSGAVLGIMAALLPLTLGLEKRQAMWSRIRTAAEVSRSVVALWDLPSPYTAAGAENFPELNEMLASLNFVKSQSVQRSIVEVEEFKEHYLSERLLDQVDYFYKQSLQAEQKAKKFRLLSKVCVISAVGLSAWTFGGPLLMGKRHVGGANWLSLLTSALFQMATIAGALIVVYDCDRRQRRYREIHRTLTDSMNDLKALRTWPTVAQRVQRVERVLLVELLEWRSLLQNMKMPRH